MSCIIIGCLQLSGPFLFSKSKRFQNINFHFIPVSCSCTKRKGYWKHNNCWKASKTMFQNVWHMYVWKICCFCFRQASLASPLRVLFVNLLFSTWQGLTSILDSSSYAKHLRNLKQKTIDKLAWQKKELKNLASYYLS